mgnify:CR=1 FL=1
MENADQNKIQHENTHDLYSVRKAKLEAMRAKGFDPFSQNWQPTHTSEEAKKLFEQKGEGQEVSLAGRILVYRLMGKASFVKIQDRKGIMQLYFSRDDLPEGKYNEDFKKMIDIGDIIGVKGKLFLTKTGEITVRVSDYKLLSKALRPLPEKWHGLTDSEQIYRQRYLDLIVNKESRDRFIMRSRIIEEIRKFLWGRDFIEVETPMLQGVAGGAAAKPFITHFNALDCQFYMRISPELFLKRCLVGGLDRVFEIGRNFRNEGIDRRHNPEFTMLEVYQAYSDYKGMMELIKSLVLHLCNTVIGTTSVKRYDGTIIELGGDWRVVDYKDLIIEKTGDKDWFSRSKAEKIEGCKRLGLDGIDETWEDYELTNEVYGKLIEPFLIQPTFVTHIEKELCPLAKINKQDSGVIDVFELCINGQEIAPAYSEQNDPFIQREMFEAQVGEEIQKLDNNFLEALEYGMPPAGGMGIGIDRLIILLTGAANIRDTILFPSLRPEQQ